MGKSSSDASTRTTTTTTSNTTTNVGLTGQDVGGLLTVFSNFALQEESQLLKAQANSNNNNAPPAPTGGGNNALLYVSIGIGVIALLFTLIRR